MSGDTQPRTDADRRQLWRDVFVAVLPLHNGDVAERVLVASQAAGDAVERFDRVWRQPRTLDKPEGGDPMSGDKYRDCPVCRRKAEAARDRQLADLKAKYGTAHPTYRMAVGWAGQPIPSADLGRIHEDYDIGIQDDGTFAVNYGSSCEKCGTTVRFAVTKETGFCPEEVQEYRFFLDTKDQKPTPDAWQATVTELDKTEDEE